MPRLPALTEWFSLTRRELMRALVGLATYLPVSVLLASPSGGSAGGVSIRALGVFLDTLLPADGASPAATELGLDAEILGLLRGNEKITKLVVLGCAWLDQQAVELGAEEFARLTDEQRVSVVTRAEQSAPRTLPHVFFAAMRDQAYRLYYAHAESWVDLGFPGPPQPRGYLGFARPPSGS